MKYSQLRHESTPLGALRDLIIKSTARLRWLIGSGLNLDIHDLPSIAEKDLAREVLHKLAHPENSWGAKQISPTVSLKASELSLFFEQVSWALMTPNLTDRDRSFREALKTYQTSQSLQENPYLAKIANDTADYLSADALKANWHLSVASEWLRDVIMGAKFDMNHIVISAYKSALDSIEAAGEEFF